MPTPSTIIPLSAISVIWLERNSRKTIMMLKAIMMFENLLDIIIASMLDLLLFAYLICERLKA
jgi:hypothetical protein